MLDIFRAGPKGVLWLGTAEDVAEARATVKRLYALSPGKYFTFEVSTQTRHVMTPEELGIPRKTDLSSYVARMGQQYNNMVESFHIFRQTSEGVLWIGVARTVENAVECARKDMQAGGGCEYIVLDIRSGGRTTLKADPGSPGVLTVVQVRD
jgi:hypothetical protein